jgi:hypothetical protein
MHGKTTIKIEVSRIRSNGCISLFHANGGTDLTRLMSVFATALRRRLNFEPLSARQDRAKCWRWQEWLGRLETCKLGVSVLIFTDCRCVNDMTRFTVIADTRFNGSRSQWQRDLRLRRAAARLLGLRVRILPGAWMSASCECCVLSGRGLCDGLVLRGVLLSVCVCVRASLCDQVLQYPLHLQWVRKYRSKVNEKERKKEMSNDIT